LNIRNKKVGPVTVPAKKPDGLYSHTTLSKIPLCGEGKGYLLNKSGEYFLAKYSFPLFIL